jgi:hypothetical protein
MKMLLNIIVVPLQELQYVSSFKNQIWIKSLKKKVFSEQLNWNAEAKVNSRNGEFVENQRRAPKPQVCNLFS